MIKMMIILMIMMITKATIRTLTMINTTMRILKLTIMNIKRFMKHHFTKMMMKLMMRNSIINSR
jgi:hypothetical protein